VNPDGKPLGGTSVIIKGTTIGTITDNNGEFELKDVPKTETWYFLCRITNSCFKSRFRETNDCHMVSAPSGLIKSLLLAS